MKALLDGLKLTIEVDLAENPQPSKTGKSLIAYTSSGFVEIARGMKMTLTVIKQK